jgi:hypothetical protein
MAYFRFKSRTRPNIVYTFTSDSMAHWDRAYRMNGVISRHFAEYDTYGDGDTQHTPESVCHKMNLEDLLASLAFDLTENADHIEMFAESHCWPTRYRTYSERDIRFALSVKYPKQKEDAYITKRAYYSVKEGKTSTSESKQYDKRWQVVPEWADGSIESAYQLLYQDHYDLLESIALYIQVEEYVRLTNDSHWCQTRYQYFKIVEGYKHCEADSQFHAIENLLRARDLTHFAKRAVEVYLSNRQCQLDAEERSREEALAKEAEKVAQ